MENSESHEIVKELSVIKSYRAEVGRISREGADEEFMALDEKTTRIGKVVKDQLEDESLLRGCEAWHMFLGSTLPDDAPERLSAGEEQRLRKIIVAAIREEFPNHD